MTTDDVLDLSLDVAPEAAAAMRPLPEASAARGFRALGFVRKRADAPGHDASEAFASMWAARPYSTWPHHLRTPSLREPARAGA